MNIWHDIDSSRINPLDFTVVIEIPKGSKAKYELDKQTGFLILDRILHTSTHYPANYGFIPRTYADDGDPLDVLVLSSEIMYPLTLVRCYPIGVMIPLTMSIPISRSFQSISSTRWRISFQCISRLKTKKLPLMRFRAPTPQSI